MKKTNSRHFTRIIIPGILCVLLLAAASCYSVKYNDSRLVTLMDFGTYHFQIQDLPMIISMILFLLYVLYPGILLLCGILSARRREKAAHTTRQLNPKLGFLGFFGFAGFLGFFTWQADQTVFPFLFFLFFLFFGFFGFYYEGKMSGTLMDERFLENRMQARLLPQTR